MGTLSWIEFCVGISKTYYDAGFYWGHQGVLQGVQIGGIVLVPSQPLPGCWGWWVDVVYTGDAGFHGGHQGGLQGAQIGGIVLAPCQSS